MSDIAIMVTLTYDLMMQAITNTPHLNHHVIDNGDETFLLSMWSKV